MLLLNFLSVVLLKGDGAGEGSGAQTLRAVAEAAGFLVGRKGG